MAGSQHLQGSVELIAKLREIGALDNGKVIAAAVRYGMEPVTRSVKLLSPVSKRPHKVYTGETVDPGYGRKSYHVVVTVDRARGFASALLGPTKRAFYMTQFVERGTLHAAPHPHLVPALYANMGNAQQRIMDLLRAYLAKRAAQP